MLLLPIISSFIITLCKENNQNYQVAVILMYLQILLGDLQGNMSQLVGRINNQTPVVRRVDNAIHWVNLYPLYSTVCFFNTYPGPDLRI